MSKHRKSVQGGSPAASRNGCFEDFLKDALGEEVARACLSALDTEASTSVRLNPLKPAASVQSVGEHFRLGAAPVPWNDKAFLLDGRPSFTLDPLFHCGVYYVQDSSAMFPAHLLFSASELFPARRPLRVLDLCAAPGGKTTDLASRLRALVGDDFLLVANELSRSRAALLAENVSRWGDPNVVVCSADPAAFTSLKGFFDIIVADVPCSGEGMFRKDPKAREQWSPSLVELCAQRQRRIVADVWPALAEDGLFLYSTCTFNRYENDDNVSWIASELGAEVLHPDGAEAVLRTENGAALAPGLVPGEGQWAALLRRRSAPMPADMQPRMQSDMRLASVSDFAVEGSSTRRSAPMPADMQPRMRSDMSLASVSGFAVEGSSTRRSVPMPAETLSHSPAGRVRSDSRNSYGRSQGSARLLPKDISSLLTSSDVQLSVRVERIWALPARLAPIVAQLDFLHLLRPGVCLGQNKGGVFVPDQDLAWSALLSPDAYPRLELDTSTALSYLKGDALHIAEASESSNSYLLLCYAGLPLGFVKNLGSRCNNLYPKSLRIRMQLPSDL